MYTKKDIQQDNTVKEFFRNRNLKKSTEENYLKVLRRYSNFIDKTPSQFIDEAEQQEEDGIRLRKRNIKVYLVDYFNDLKDNNFTEKYIQYSMTIVRTFYKEFEIELPRVNTKIKNGSSIKTNDEIITIEHVKKAMDFANLKYKAIMVLGLSSGMGGAEIRSLTIEDFLEAIKYSGHEFTVKELIEFISDKNIVPEWTVTRQKTQMDYFTFSSPESIKHILDYLAWREPITGQIKREEPLFSVHVKSKGIIKPIEQISFTSYFGKLNNQCGFGKKKDSKQGFFTFHRFREFFGSKLFEKGIQQLYVDWMLGHTINKVTDAYFKPNMAALKEEYLKVLPELIVQDKKEIRLIEPDEYKQLRDDMEKMKEELQKQQILSAQLESILEAERFEQEDEEFKREFLGEEGYKRYLKSKKE